jgi:plastocyanin
MNHYHIAGGIILLLVIALGAISFWPINHIPSVAVNFPTTPEETKADDVTKPAAVKPKTTPTTTTAGAGARTFEKGVYVTTIYFTDKGFVPAVVEATHGEEVRFINKTSAAMHIIAEEKTSSIYYRSINQSNTVFKGGTYQLQLPELGVFNYKNLNSSSPQTGQILVK